MFGGTIGTAVILAVVLLPLWTPASLSAATNIFSPTVSYLYSDGAAVSPVVSYQYLEWPGNDVLGLLNSRTVSYFYQIGNGATLIVMQGTVTDPTGTGISGATVKASVSQLVVAQTTTDAGGHYALPALGAGVYVLQVSEATHASAARALTLNANTAQQNFQLALLPAAPAVAQTTRQPSPTYTPSPSGPMGSTLKVFDGSHFVPITAGNQPSANRMTIVMTHGWVKTNIINSSIMNTPFDQWPTNMAVLMRANGITPGVANILAWDWRYAAEDCGEGPLGLEPAFAAGHVPDQGVALGQSLTNALGANYTQNLHFIGHSLGALVNSGAINFLHGDRTGGAGQGISTTPWNNAQIHVTLLDQAEIAESIENDFFHVEPPAWQDPMPVHFTWADNYKSLVSLYTFPMAVNVNLQNNPYFSDVKAAHGYPVDWYSMSITNPFDVLNPLGFGQSYEFYLSIGDSFLFPPTTFQPGTLFKQSSDSDPLALVRDFTGQLVSIGADIFFQGVNGTITVVGNVSATVESAAQSAGQSIEQGFNNTVSAAEQGLNSIVNVFNSSVLKLNLTTGLWNPFTQQSPRGLPQPLDGGGQNNTAAMAWLPIQIPTNALAMAFDFAVSGDPVDDVMECGINDTNLFSLAAKYIPTNTISTSQLLDVSQWSGQQVELFFGFLGGTSTNATLQIDNIRFYSFERPSLQGQVSGGNLMLSWPMSAQNFSLQTTTNLANPNSWTTLTNVPSTVNLQNIITNPVVGSQGFYRLIQSQ